MCGVWRAAVFSCAHRSVLWWCVLPRDHVSEKSALFIITMVSSFSLLMLHLSGIANVVPVAVAVPVPVANAVVVAAVTVAIAVASPGAVTVSVAVAAGVDVILVLLPLLLLYGNAVPVDIVWVILASDSNMETVDCEIVSNWGLSGADPGFQRRGCVLKTRYIHKKT